MPSVVKVQSPNHWTASEFSAGLLYGWDTTQSGQLENLDSLGEKASRGWSWQEGIGPEASFNSLISPRKFSWLPYFSGVMLKVSRPELFLKPALLRYSIHTVTCILFLCAVPWVLANVYTQASTATIFRYRTLTSLHISLCSQISFLPLKMWFAIARAFCK